MAGTSLTLVSPVRYPNWFNSMFEFGPKLIQFNIQFKLVSPKFNSKDYSIKSKSSSFNSMDNKLNVVIQFNKLFKSTDCWIQLKSNLIVCPYFSLSVTKIWNLANYRTFFGYFEATSHFFLQFFFQYYFFSQNSIQHFIHL